MTNYIELQNYLTAVQCDQDIEFHTTDFWAYATNELSKVLEQDTIKQFRNDKACLTYFVPTYGYPAMGLSTDQIDEISDIANKANLKQRNTISQFISGQSHATADHRAIQACITALGHDPFQDFDESEIGEPKEQFIFSGNRFSRPTHNYMLGLLFLISHQKDAKFNSVIELGGGHGALGEILFKSKLNTKSYINFDIPPTCIFAEFYLSQIFPEKFKSDLKETWNSSVHISDLDGLYVRPNWDIQYLEGSVDLFVNYHSFQEMEPFVVKRYLKEINRLEPSFLLLRNIREGKQKKIENNLGVETPTKGSDYIDWLQDNYELIAQDARTFGFVTADNFHSELSLWKHR